MAKIRERYQDMAYRVYLTDCLSIINENIASAFGGKQMSISYRDIIKPKKEEKRTAEEIKSHIQCVLQELS